MTCPFGGLPLPLMGSGPARCIFINALAFALMFSKAY
jgi:hypothetical protein